MTDEPNQVEPPAAPVVEPSAQPAQTQEPTFDKARLDSTLRFLAAKPEAKEYVLQQIGDDSRITKLELELATERIMRHYKLPDDDRDLIEAPTVEAIAAKAEKLAKRNASLEAQLHANDPQPEPEVKMPDTQPQYKNPLELAYARLERSKP